MNITTDNKGEYMWNLFWFLAAIYGVAQLNLHDPKIQLIIVVCVIGYISANSQSNKEEE